MLPLCGATSMQILGPEHPAAAPQPAPIRCADLPTSLVGAGPEVVEQVASSLAGQLEQLGWKTVSSTPGLRMYSKNGRMLAVDQILGMLASGHLSAGKWNATCAADGISNLMVAVPLAQAVSTQLVDPFSLPVAMHPDPAAAPPSVRWNIARIAVIVLLLAGVLWIQLILPWYQQSHLAGHNQPKSEKEVKADGRLSVNNGGATADYDKKSREFESVEVQRSDFYYDDLTLKEDSTLSKWNSHGRDLTQIVYSRSKFDLNTPRGLALWLNNRNVGESQAAKAILTPEKVKVDGKTGWAWEYKTPKGWWIYSVRIPQGKESYNYNCRVMPGEDALERQARCKSVASTLKIRGDRK